MKRFKKLRLLVVLSVCSIAIIFCKTEAKENVAIKNNDETIHSNKKKDISTSKISSAYQTNEIKDLALAPKKKPPHWNVYVVAKGDNFSSIGARKLGLNSTEIAEIIQLSKKTITLSQLNQGQKIYFSLNKKGVLQNLKFPIKPGLEYLIKRKGDSFTGRKIKQVIVKKNKVYGGIISHSLSRAMQAQGLPYSVAIQASHLLNKRYNLHRDLRTGDQFEVIITYDEVNGKLFSPTLEALSLHGSRINTSLFRYFDGHYYDAKGQGLEPGFSRYPFAHHYRISSPFNLHRRHPITGKICPHYGTDFATPVGTKVLAPADGKVKKIGYQRYAGKYLEVTQYNGYETRYLHLSKILVKKNQVITAGENIALTGNTGRTTGPHLHYELREKGIPVNSMLAVLPVHKALQGKTLNIFLKEVASKIAILNRANQLTALGRSGVKKRASST